MGKPSKPTIGYRYRPAFHHGLTIGPIDAFLEFRGGDKVAWQGELTASGTIHVSAPRLWGGDKDQGGIEGDLDVMFGEPTQMPNAYLVSVFGDKTAAWRGFATVAWKGGVYGAMNPYPQDASYKIRRILQGWDGGVCWYPERAACPGGGTGANAQVYTDFVTGFNTNAPTKFQIIDGAIANTTVNSSNTDYYRTPVPGFTITGMRADFVITADGRGDCLGVTLQDAGGNYLFGFIPRAEDVYDPVRRPMVNYWQAPATVNVCEFALSIGVPYTFEAQFNVGAGMFSFSLRDAGGALIGSGTAPTPGGAPAFLAFGRTSNAFPPDISICKYTRVEVTGYSMSGYINPAHVLYDSRTCADMGREPTANINEVSLQAAADKLYAESFGICPSWDPAAESVDEFEKRIAKLIGGSFNRSLEDGQWYLDLARGDYVLEDLPILTDDDILQFEDQPSVLDNAVNSVSVRYFDVERKETVVTSPVRSLALVAAFGVIHQTYDYPEIPEAALAMRVATRELLTTSRPTRGFKLVTTRKTYAWRPNQYFRLLSVKRGIADMVCIVGEKEEGTLKSGAIRMTATQDISGLPLTVFVDVEAGVDTRPSQDPTAIVLQRALEAPYVLVVASHTRADLAALPIDVGFGIAVAVAPAGELDYTMTADDGSGYVDVGAGQWCATATVVESSIGCQDTDFTLDDAVGLERVAVGMGVLWEDEWCRVDAIDGDTGTITLGRGCADTVPAATHIAGSRLWFYETGFAYDPTEYSGGEAIGVKLLTNTGSRQLAPDLAAPMSIAFDDRQARPYPPGQLRFSDDTQASVAYPPTLAGPITTSWVHRDRVLQSDQLVDAEAAGTGPEAGTTYRASYQQPPGTEVDTEAGIAGTAATPYEFALSGTSRIEVFSERDGYTSWQGAGHTFEYTSNVDAAQLAASSILKKLVSWWARDEASGTVMLDSHTYGQHGTYSGVTLGAAALATNLGAAVTFPSSGTPYAEVPDSNVIKPTGDLACMVWGKRVGAQAASFPKLAWKPGSNKIGGYANYLLQIDNPTAGGKVMGRVTSGTTQYDALSSASLADGVVKCYVVQREQTVVALYENSALQNSVSTLGASAALSVSTNPLRFGYHGATNDKFIGVQSAAALFWDSLTDAELIYLYNEGDGRSYAQVVSDANVGTATVDDFSTNTLASYTELADTTATWQITAGYAQATTSPIDSLLVRNAVSFVDGEVTAVVARAEDAGLALRVQDVSNYYLAVFHDASSGTGLANQVQLFKRVAGAFTQIGATVSIAAAGFTRDQERVFAFEAVGDQLTVRMNGQIVLDETDSAIAAAGQCGIRADTNANNRFLCFSWRPRP